MQAMSMSNANLQKELLAMSAAMNAKDNEQLMKSRKGKSAARGSYSNNKSMPQQFQNSSRAKDGMYDSLSSYNSSKPNDVSSPPAYSR